MTAKAALSQVVQPIDPTVALGTATKQYADGKQPLDSDLTAIAAIAPANDDLIQRKAGAWANRTPAQLKTDLVLVKADVGLSNVDNNSDATYSASTATLTNKRITPRIATVTSSATVTPTADTADEYTVTAQAAACTLAAPSGTPADGQKLLLRMKDNGTARTLAWNAIYRAIGVTLPATTVISKTLYVGCIFNAADTKWDVIAVAMEA